MVEYNIKSPESENEREGNPQKQHKKKSSYLFSNVVSYFVALCWAKVPNTMTNWLLNNTIIMILMMVMMMTTVVGLTSKGGGNEFIFEKKIYNLNYISEYIVITGLH